MYWCCRLKYGLIAIVICVSWIGFNSFSYCDLAYSKNNTMSIHMREGKPLYPGYPIIFDIQGRIDRLSDNVIVVNDTLFKLSDNIVYNTPNGNDVRQDQFRKGDFVGMKLNSNGIVVAVWLLKGGKI